MMNPLFFALLLQFASSNAGELDLRVTDASGLPLFARVELVSEGNDLRETLSTDLEGHLTMKRLPFGVYRVSIAADGFAPSVTVTEVRSALPAIVRVALSVAPLQSQITVTPDDTLLDPGQAMTVRRLGKDTILHSAVGLPGRALPNLVNTQPGWLMEANGVLHPRGSEYQTLFVVDGLPLTDNRSPAFAPEIDGDTVAALNIVTGGFPAEYGRKLGGVIEVVTSSDAQRGVHGRAILSTGSFGTKTGDLLGQLAGAHTTLNVTAGAATTNRYLDPPTEENERNQGTTTHLSLRVEQDLTDRDRLGVIVRHGESRFAVPNERVQQSAGQRQDRDSQETAGQFSYQRVLSQPWLVDVRGMARQLETGFWSNEASTPIAANQARSIREIYLRATASGHAGIHEWKIGADADASTMEEQFGYRITNRESFDPRTPTEFAFDERRTGREHALFAQDQIHQGPWTVSAGLRWDHYRVLVEDNAFSPRLGLAWSWPAAQTVVRASYDRVFQTPAVENLLLASSPSAHSLSDQVIRLPIPPSRGNFFEMGISKGLFQALRIDVNHFVRGMTDFADDDLLLNTGVSFPIAFSRARIRGTEVKLEVPRWRALTGFVSYAYMRGTADLPITGGLFLGDEAIASLESTDRLPISQDQRHTVRGRLFWQHSSLVWLGLAAAYDSGLPVEFDGDQDDAMAQYGTRIVDRVDFEHGRLRPSVTMDLSGGWVVTKVGTREVSVHVDVKNLANGLNVINFAGLFSGTAIGAPRSIAGRIQLAF